MLFCAVLLGLALYQQPAMEADLYWSLNQVRVNAGVHWLERDGTLDGIASYRAHDMAGKGYFSHVPYDGGPTAFRLLTDSGYWYRIGGENIARNNYPDEASVGVAMEGLRASGTHAANMLDRRFTRVGVAAVNDGCGMKYLVMVFAG